MSINLSTIGLGYDTTFELDKFGKPRLRSQGELAKNVLLTVLFYKPGNYPSLPTIGLNIEQMLYSFYDDIKEDSLKDLIISQCNALGVFFNTNQIMIKKTKYRDHPSLMINVDISGDEFIEATNIDDEGGNSFLIGITFDELNSMIYNVSEGRAD